MTGSLTVVQCAQRSNPRRSRLSSRIVSAMQLGFVLVGFAQLVPAETSS